MMIPKVAWMRLKSNVKMQIQWKFCLVFSKIPEVMSLQKTLMNTRAGRTMLISFGLAKEPRSKSYFGYKIGKNSERKNDDYFLYFKKDNVSPEIVDNFAFNEIAAYGADYGLNFLKFQVERSDQQEAFLRYLQVAIANRKNTYAKNKRERFDFCLAWVNEQLASIANIQQEKDQLAQIKLISNIHLENEASNVTSQESGAGIHEALEALKMELKNLHALTQLQRPSQLYLEKLEGLTERLERVDKAIGLFELGHIATFSDKELQQFVFLLLALQSYQLNNNPGSPKFFTRLTKIDITELLKSNFKYYNAKAFKTSEKEVNKFDEAFKKFDLSCIHRDLKKLLSGFSRNI